MYAEFGIVALLAMLVWGISLCIQFIPRDTEDSLNIHKLLFIPLISPNSPQRLQQLIQLIMDFMLETRYHMIWN